MKLESLAFDQAQLDVFRRQLMEHDRELLVRRLEAAGARVAELAASVSEEAAASDGWNAREVLAHVQREARHRDLLHLELEMLQADLAKLERWYDQIRSRDYFSADASLAAEAALFTHRS